MFGRLIVVLATLSRDEQHVQITASVTLNFIVEGVIDCNSVNDEVVSVDFRFRCVDSDLPDAVRALGHFLGPGPRVGHPVSGELYSGSVIGVQTEGHLSVLDFRRHDAVASAHGEVGQFLG